MRLLATFLLVFVSCPVLADALLLPDDEIKAGQVLYMKKCMRCHGKTAEGGNGPDIQGILYKDVVAAAEGVENMPKVTLDDLEARQIATFLMSLAPDQARTRLGLQ
ncbi:cytochrome c [Roseibium sp. MMSF_3544]|uniref:c-type cytochrome n=1 Tax=unclassified Roseibium TaxID=2629323 RepID=UPI00273F4D6E|nr:cytochrome c [Roseibium sp. MMSF_3544]